MKLIFKLLKKFNWKKKNVNYLHTFLILCKFQNIKIKNENVTFFIYKLKINKINNLC